MNELHKEIDSKQQSITEIKKDQNSPDSLRQKLTQNRNVFIDSVDRSQAELIEASRKMQSKEAKDFLIQGSERIKNYLLQILSRSQQIKSYQQGTIKNEASDNHHTEIDTISKTLQNELSAQKEAISSFAALEEIEHNNLADIKKENDLLNNSTGNTEPTLILQKKEYLSNKIQALEDKYKSHPLSRAYYDQVKKVESDLFHQIKQEKDFLQKKAIIEHKNINESFIPEVNKTSDLIGLIKNEKNMQALESLKALLAKLNPDQIKTKLNWSTQNNFNYAENLKNHLIEIVDEMDKKLYEAKLEVEKLEKETINLNCVSMVKSVESSEKEHISPIWKEYQDLIKLDNPNSNQSEKIITLEGKLLNSLVTLSLVLKPFKANEAYTQLLADNKTLIDSASKSIDDKIKTIEENKTYRNANASLSGIKLTESTMGRWSALEAISTLGVRTREETVRTIGALSNYVKILKEAKNGKIYEFTPEYNNLSEERKTDVRMAVEELIQRHQNDAKADTSRVTVLQMESGYGHEKIKEKLGNKGLNYANGIKALSEGNINIAKTAFNDFISSLSEEDRNQEPMKTAYEIAKDRIEFIKTAEMFYEGMVFYRDGNNKEAENSLKKYLSAVSNLDDRNKSDHAEERLNAADIIKIINLKKIDQINSLFDDVKEWKKAQLAKKTNVQINLNGPEVIMLESGIKKLQERILDGELFDFDIEFERLRQNTMNFLNKNAISNEDNLVEKIITLYEGLNSDDPEKKQKTLIAFANELRNLESYDKAKEYLDKALEEAYKSVKSEVSMDSVSQKMLNDSSTMASIRETAKLYLDDFKREYPDAPIDVLRNMAEQSVFKMRLEKQYNKELRRTLTGRSGSQISEALALYNRWDPLQNKKWYDFSTYSVEEYDQFRKETEEFILITGATLPLGIGAGALVRMGGGAASRQLMIRSANAILLKKGGGQAATSLATGELLQNGAQAAGFKILNASAQRAILNSRILIRTSTIASEIAIEGAFMGLAGSAVHAGVTGEAMHLSSQTIAQSVLTYGLFRGINASTMRLMAKSMQSGASGMAATFVVSEGFSAVAGVGVDISQMAYYGNLSQVDMEYIMKSGFREFMMAGASAVGHSINSPRPPVSQRQPRINRRTLSRHNNVNDPQRRQTTRNESSGPNSLSRTTEEISGVRRRPDAPTEPSEQAIRLAAGAENQNDQQRPPLRVIEGGRTSNVEIIPEVQNIRQSTISSSDTVGGVSLTKSITLTKRNGDTVTLPADRIVITETLSSGNKIEISAALYHYVLESGTPPDKIKQVAVQRFHAAQKNANIMAKRLEKLKKRFSETIGEESFNNATFEDFARQTQLLVRDDSYRGINLGSERSKNTIISLGEQMFGQVVPSRINSLAKKPSDSELTALRTTDSEYVQVQDDWIIPEPASGARTRLTPPPPPRRTTRDASETDITRVIRRDQLFAPGIPSSNRKTTRLSPPTRREIASNLGTLEGYSVPQKQIIETQLIRLSQENNLNIADISAIKTRLNELNSVKKLEGQALVTFLQRYVDRNYPKNRSNSTINLESVQKQTINDGSDAFRPVPRRATRLVRLVTELNPPDASMRILKLKSDINKQNITEARTQVEGILVEFGNKVFLRRKIDGFMTESNLLVEQIAQNQLRQGNTVSIKYIRDVYTQKIIELVNSEQSIANSVRQRIVQKLNNLNTPPRRLRNTSNEEINSQTRETSSDRINENISSRPEAPSVQIRKGLESFTKDTYEGLLYEARIKSENNPAATVIKNSLKNATNDVIQEYARHGFAGIKPNQLEILILKRFEERIKSVREIYPSIRRRYHRIERFVEFKRKIELGDFTPKQTPPPFRGRQNISRAESVQQSTRQSPKPPIRVPRRRTLPDIASERARRNLENFSNDFYSDVLHNCNINSKSSIEARIIKNALDQAQKNVYTAKSGKIGTKKMSSNTLEIETLAQFETIINSEARLHPSINRNFVDIMNQLSFTRKVILQDTNYVPNLVPPDLIRRSSQDISENTPIRSNQESTQQIPENAVRLAEKLLQDAKVKKQRDDLVNVIVSEALLKAKDAGIQGPELRALEGRIKRKVTKQINSDIQKQIFMNNVNQRYSTVKNKISRWLNSLGVNKRQRNANN